MAQAKEQSPAKQLAAFMEPYTPDVQKTARAALKKLRAQMPGATEMVYDTFNALVIGFAPGRPRHRKPSCRLASIPSWVNLYFLDGAFLHDPESMLKGSGNRVRTLRLDDAAIIAGRPAVQGAHRRSRCECRLAIRRSADGV